MNWRGWVAATGLMIVSSTNAAHHAVEVAGRDHHRHATCRIHPHYSFSQPTVVARRIARLDVHFTTTCGHLVRAVVIHPSAGGSAVDVGNETRGHRLTSTVISRDPVYCLLGWELRGRHGWERKTLRRRGRC